MEEESISYWGLYGIGTFSTIYLFMLIAIHFSEAKERRLYKKLKAVVDSQENLESEERTALFGFLFK